MARRIHFRRKVPRQRKSGGDPPKPQESTRLLQVSLRVSVWKRLEAERGRKSLERGKRVGYQEVLEALIEGHLPLA